MRDTIDPRGEHEWMTGETEAIGLKEQRWSDGQAAAGTVSCQHRQTNVNKVQYTPMDFSVEARPVPAIQ